MANTAYQNFIKKKLDKGEQITGKMIEKLIQDHLPTKNKSWKSWQRYLGSAEGVPILTRKMPDYTKINSKLSSDYAGEIVDSKVNFFCGIPINFEIDKNSYAKKPKGMVQKVFDAIVGMKVDRYKIHSDKLKEFVQINNMADLMVEQAKVVSSCGHAGQEIYIDPEDGQVRVVNLYPWETIFITDVHGTVYYALRYYQELDNNEEMVTKAEFFSKDSISFYVENKDKRSQKEQPYILDNEYLDNPKAHIFQSCPIIKYLNNAEEQSDYEKIETLIDGYNRTFSDVSSELESVRLAYFVFTGGKKPTKEILEQLLQTGALHNEDEKGKVEFLTKNLNDTAVENHLERLEKNINRFAKHVNFSDEAFASNISGVAMKFKLMAINGKVQILENKFRTSLTQLMKLVCHVWNLQKIDISYLDVFMTFKRNMPVDLLNEAQASAALKGLVSERTRLSKTLSFVDDVDYELEQMKQDAEMFETQYTDPNANLDEEYNLNNLGDEDESKAV